MTTAIILAGGMGTRLRSAVPDLPKPMAPIDGRPFLEHQMDYWIGQGVDRFVVSVGYKKEVIMDHFGASYRSKPLIYAIEDKPLGTGGGLLLAAQGLREPFLVLNGDTFFEVDLAKLLKFHADHSADWTFSLFRTIEVERYMGVEVKSNGEIVSLKSGTGEKGRLANGGVYLVNPSVLMNGKFVPGSKLSLEEDLLPALGPQCCKLCGIEFPGTFIDIGVPQDYFRAATILSK
jgi:D-glycero-alpha-D-manno-heptose 1-phosphate guanylyltransferase